VLADREWGKNETKGYSELLTADRDSIERVGKAHGDGRGISAGGAGHRADGYSTRLSLRRLTAGEQKEIGTGQMVGYVASSTRTEELSS